MDKWTDGRTDGRARPVVRPIRTATQ